MKAPLPNSTWIAALAALLLLGAAPNPRPAIELGPPPPEVPQRIVTLAPSLTETLIAIDPGLRGAIVGVTRFDDHPAVRDRPKVGGYIDPSLEAILALRPDLVLAEPAPGNRSVVERLGKLGVPVRAFFLGTPGEILAAIEGIGALVGCEGRGRQMRSELVARMERVRSDARKRPPVRALVVYGWEPLTVAGPGSFPDDLLRKAGGENAAPAQARASWPVLTAEGFLSAGAEVIVDASDVHPPTRERLLRLPGLSHLRIAPASANLLRPGPRLADAVEELFNLLHPKKAKIPGGAAQAAMASDHSR